jgi:VWFA-related protein
MSINPGRWLSLLLLVLGAALLSGRAQNPLSNSGSGRIFVDVVVTPKSGPPVSGLQQQDFTLLDNKTPQTLASFQAFDGGQAPIEIIVVIDDVNTGLENVAFERSEIHKFLLADGGQLAHPVAFAFLTDDGLRIQDQFSTDGKALSASLDQYSVGLHSIRRTTGIYGAAERFQLSLDALRQLVDRESAQPGRKFILWVSPGWPLLSGPGVEEQLNAKQQQEIFGQVVGFSSALRQSRITLYSIDPLGSSDSGGRAFHWESFTKGISKPNQAEWGNLALQVIATQSGGLALTSGNDVAAELKKCVADSQAYYEISFDPPQGDQPHEYHHLEIRMAKRGLTARTREGFYSQP